MNYHSYIITGSSSYLGMALAVHLAKNKDNKLLLTSRKQCPELEKLQNERIRYIPFIDLTTDDGLDCLYNHSADFFDSPFNILNCVGYFPGYKPIQEISIQEARTVLESNVLSVYGVANRLLPLMEQKGGGHFISFSMHTTYQNYPLMAIFTAAKAAIESLTVSISNEYLKSGIYANVISLATLLTELEQKIKPHGDHLNWLKTEEVCIVVEDFIQHSHGIINGSILHSYKYSDSFFGDSYFNRIKE